MERKKDLEKLSLYFLIIMFTVGIIGHSFNPLLNLMLHLTPFTLLLTGAVVLYHYVYEDSIKIIGILLLIYVITFFVEVAGVETGIIFGNYYYGEVLGLKLLGVPLIIGFNWTLIILGAYVISIRITRNSFLIASISGLIAVVFDYSLEPVAIKLKYWVWEGDIVPARNYLAWFIIAFFSALILTFSGFKNKRYIAFYYVIIQFIFFLILSIAL